MMGYKDKPDKTLEAVDEEGWVRSGDLGKVDKKGFFLVTGRIKELLITSGGENIPPFLIEDNIKVGNKYDRKLGRIALECLNLAERAAESIEQRLPRR